jgi:hypothetical protein
MDRFVAEYKTGSLTADNVKRAINEAGGSGGAIQYLNLWYFSKESLESGAPFVLVDADRLITLADVYNAARRSLPPEVRQAYGFAHIDIFDRLGNKCYWEYMLEQEMKAKRQGGARSDRANVSNQ